MAVMMNGINKKVIQQQNFFSNGETYFAELCDFYISGFQTLSNVTIEKKREGTNNLSTLYIYLNENKSMYIKLYYDLYLNVNIYMDVIKNNTVYLSSSCTYEGGNNGRFMHFYFFISTHGIIFTIPNSSMGVNSDDSPYTDKQLLNYYENNYTADGLPICYLNGIFVTDDEPTIFWNFNNNYNANSGGTTNAYRIFSLNHAEQEIVQEKSMYFADNFGSQKILLIHAFSFDYSINTPHLYRVLGISNDTAPGRISVSGKTLFWIGRFALEFNE